MSDPPAPKKLKKITRLDLLTGRWNAATETAAIIAGLQTLDLQPGWFQRAVDEALSKPTECECKKALITLNDEIIEKHREPEEQENGDA